jgi:hypothetical protein
MEAKYRFFAHLSCTHINQLDANGTPVWGTLEREEYQVTLTCWLGKADVLRVSCVSSAGFLLGMLKINAAWSRVAAVAVMRKPLSQRLWIPSLGYKKSSSTTYNKKILETKNWSMQVYDMLNSQCFLLGTSVAKHVEVVHLIFSKPRELFEQKTDYKAYWCLTC